MSRRCWKPACDFARHGPFHDRVVRPQAARALKVSIACALVHNHAVLMMGALFGALDAIIRTKSGMISNCSEWSRR